MDIISNTISFKSVGVRFNEVPEDNSKVDIPISIKMPMSLGQANDGIFAMTFDLQSTIKQNLKNLLLTNWGERLGRYFFGANIRAMTMEFNKIDTFDSEIAIRIKSAVAKWMPYVELQDMQRNVEFNDVKGMAKLRINIIYAVPSTNIKQDAVEIILFISG